MAESFPPEKLSISARLLYEEAQRRGITCTLLDAHLIRMEQDGASWYTRGSRTSFQSSVGLTIADRKDIAKLIFETFDIPTAKFVVLRNQRDFTALNELTFPVVVKPSAGKQGEGVIVGVSSPSVVRQLMATVQLRPDESYVVEEMLEGTEYRVLCIDGRFFAATVRKAAFVTGDGHSSVEELIQRKNEHPWRGKGHSSPLSFITVDAVVHANLAEQQLRLDSVVPAGQEVRLRKTANLSTGGEPSDVTDEVCPENRALFERIARVCDLNTIGIDVMCQDITQPLSQQPRAGVIEVNASPGLRMHHYPLEGTPRDAAAAILDMVAKKREGTQV